MLKLKHENFIKAHDYIFAHGDDINRAWFRYLFENNDTDEFLNVLSKYQQEDGGFGGIYYEFDYVRRENMSIYPATWWEIRAVLFTLP